MKLVLAGAMLALATTACGGGGGGGFEPPPAVRDTVYILPYFGEAVGTDLIPQINDYDWRLDSTVADRNGSWALSGSTVVLKVHSPLYETLDSALAVPDTVSPDPDGVRRYHPLITLHRLVPALLGAEWAADFAGPTIRIEIYAPHGLAGVRLTSTSVYYQACRELPFPCDSIINGAVGGDPWADPSATGLQGWATLTGQWWGWPSALPPDGYGGEGPERAWDTVVSVNIADDQGHVGHGGCERGFIPSGERELKCSVLFER